MKTVQLELCVVRIYVKNHRSAIEVADLLSKFFNMLAKGRTHGLGYFLLSLLIYAILRM